MKINENKKILGLLAIATIFTLAAGALYFFMFFAIKEKTQATAAITEKMDELTGKETRLASSIASLKRENQNIEKISAYFFTENEIVDFTKRVEALGMQSGTTLTIEALDQGVTEKTIPFLNLRIKATGSFANIEALLSLLENFPGKLEWKTLQFVRDGNTDGKGSVTPQWRAEALLVALNFVNQ